MGSLLTESHVYGLNLLPGEKCGGIAKLRTELNDDD